MAIPTSSADAREWDRQSLVPPFESLPPNECAPQIQESTVRDGENAAERLVERSRPLARKLGRIVEPLSQVQQGRKFEPRDGEMPHRLPPIQHVKCT
jgi:hypothetical protein